MCKCAACVISAIGAPEDKPFDTSAPKKIDGEAAIALVEEAKSSGVKRFIMVTSLGTTKIGWPASVLNLFWGVLYWKRLSEEALIRSGMAYTIIRPGGMERPTDTYKETHNTVLYPRDTQFGGQVSRLQVMSLFLSPWHLAHRSSTHNPQPTNTTGLLIPILHRADLLRA